MSKLGVRNIASYNERAASKRQEQGRAFLTRTVQTGFDDQGRPVYESEKPFDLNPCPSSSWWWTKWPT